MRKAIVSWSVGLICVSALAGCRFAQCFREGCCGDKQGTACTKPAETAEAGAGKSSAYKTTSRTRPGLLAPKKDDSKKSVAPSLPPPEMPPKVLPDPKNITQPAPKPMPREISDDHNNLIEIVPLDPHTKVVAGKPTIKSAANVTAEPPPMGPSPSIRSSAKEEVIHESSKSGEKNIAIKSTSITYGQIGNFKEVTGQVTLYRKTFRLRYASVAQEDQYGGVVVLEGGAELSKLRDQVHVRVRGELIPPEDRNGPARYRVKSMEILD